MYIYIYIYIYIYTHIQSRGVRQPGRQLPPTEPGAARPRRREQATTMYIDDDMCI